jgi:predicted Zn-dependent protease
LARPIANTIPFELENQIGSAARQSLNREWAECSGPGNAELTSLVNRLEQQLDAPYTIQVSVVRAGLKNAFALPGGHIVITNALLSFMEGPDELAGVLAHEMGHVALRHPLENMLSQLGVLLAVNVVIGGGSSDIAGLGALFATTSYTRDYERLADDFALDLLRDAKISPSGYANLFQRFNEIEQDGSSGLLGLSNLLRTHPLSIDRAALATQAADILSLPTLDQNGWTSIVELCRNESDDDALTERVDKGKPGSTSPSANALP